MQKTIECVLTTGSPVKQLDLSRQQVVMVSNSPLEVTSGSIGKRLQLREKSSRVFIKSSARSLRRTSMGTVFMPVKPEQLKDARYLGPFGIKLTFADRRVFRLPIRKLEMPVGRIRWSTVVVSANGEAMTVTGVKGDKIPISSATLRYLVDKEYAAQVDASLKASKLSRDELKKMAHDSPPPPEWYDQPEMDLTRESWK